MRWEAGGLIFVLSARLKFGLEDIFQIGIVPAGVAGQKRKDKRRRVMRLKITGFQMFEKTGDGGSVAGK